MEPLERLLNLVGMLLETQTPLTFEQIRAALEPYRHQNPDSAKRMFERDKDVLREYGVPLELVDLDAWGGEQGYVIPKDRYYLPDISFTPEELGALLVAAQNGGQDPAAEQGMRSLAGLETAWNWVLADGHGNIGYQMSGLCPRRRAGVRGFVPLRGWDRENGRASCRERV